MRSSRSTECIVYPKRALSFDVSSVWKSEASIVSQPGGKNPVSLAADIESPRGCKGFWA